MPLYDYGCKDCGPFRTWQSMDEAASPAQCPECGQTSARLVCAPNVNRMDGGMRNALNRCERSADSPSVVRSENLGELGRPMHDHHHAHHDHSPNKRWMIGH
ncbi:FmdB family zinc ribbon protein [Ferruginivarius sediminum]|uniref:Zinc ribbon domain-containing protein n=1 Tax=Ferruginivarius sediminum TaxID=2661937 RepID=A0A369T812_9PROT|nr:zinc ribbon domain-containing protein [Ferruginivarius sediminum]RDD60317.1 zinc ribbon domain-containing protein [Ferruginivarius sediminum]